MASLSEQMMKKYGGKSEEKEEKSEGSDDEGSKLGSKLKSAIASGDGEMIYNAYAALHAHCNMKS